MNRKVPLALTTSTTAGIFSQNGIAPMPLAWRNAITETFFKNSLQLGIVGNPSTKLGLRNLWIQDRIPTAPTGTTSIVNGNSLCVGKIGA